MRLTFIKVFNCVSFTLKLIIVIVSFTLKLIIVIVSFTLKLIIVIVIKGQGQGRNVMRQEYEGVEPYINDLQSKCIAVCNISLFFVAKALD